MEQKKLLVQELEDLPEDFVAEVLDFVRFLKMKVIQQRRETALLSEAALQDWLRPEEDEAWRDL